MDLIELGNTFFQNPANVWIAYVVAVFFAVDAIVLRWLGRRMVRRAGESVSGVQQQSPASSQPELDRARKTRLVLNLAANFSTAIAAVILVMAYLNS